MVFFLQSSGDDADDALVKFVVHDADAVVRVHVERGDVDFGFLAHLLFNRFSLVVHFVQCLRELLGFVRRIAQQTANAERHVVQASSRVQSWAEGKTKIEGGGFGEIASGDLQQRADARRHFALPYAAQALRDQNAVVVIEFDHVGDGAERDEIEQLG